MSPEPETQKEANIWVCERDDMSGIPNWVRQSAMPHRFFGPFVVRDEKKNVLKMRGNV